MVNSVTVTSPTHDPNPFCLLCTTPPISGQPKADIEVVKMTSNNTYLPGGTIMYTIKVMNHGPSDAKDVKIADVAPNGTQIQNWTATATGVLPPHTNGTGTLDELVPFMPNGSVITYNVLLKINPDRTGALTNTALVSSPTPDPDPNCPQCTTPPIFEKPLADVVTEKTTANASYTPGGTVAYQIVVKNNGPSDARDVKVQDIAPTKTIIESWTAVGSGVNPPNANGNNNLNETISVLPNGATITYTVVLKVAVGQDRGTEECGEYNMHHYRS